MNQPRLHRPTRSTRERRAGVSLAAALLATVVLVVGCGGGGGGDAGAGGTTPGTPGTPGTGGPTGAWYYDGHFGSATRFDLSTRAEIEARIAGSASLGYGGGMFTDTDEQVSITSAPNQYTVNLRSVTPNPFSLKSSLATFPLPGGFVVGPIQPSPNGTLFAMQTRESAGLSEPFIDYVYVFDSALNITFKRAGYRAPAWLANDRLVVAADDGLYTMTVAASPTVARLGQPGTATNRPMVSPDGRSVAFLQGDIVWRIGTDGSGLTQLTVAKIEINWPAWSPDGSQIVLVSGICGQFAGPDLVIISATATNQNVYQAATVKRNNGAPARSCGPVYWLP
jgi:WD40-like Beta Propeller Repeat